MILTFFGICFYANNIVLFIVDICVHKICREIAILLKQIEDNK